MLGRVVATRGEVHLVVRPMVRVARLAEVPIADPRVTWRYWCFDTVEAADLAARLWDGAPTTAPVGWVRFGGARP